MARLGTELILASLAGCGLSAAAERSEPRVEIEPFPREPDSI
jgi:hypothetical protein